eukprot:scaffold22635_cov134-Cylindrotheca_fusiformis.AAC.12
MKDPTFWLLLLVVVHGNRSHRSKLRKRDDAVRTRQTAINQPGHVHAHLRHGQADKTDKRRVSFLCGRAKAMPLFHTSQSHTTEVH